jgi:hypothetical protein
MDPICAPQLKSAKAGWPVQNGSARVTLTFPVTQHLLSIGEAGLRADPV